MTIDQADPMKSTMPITATGHIELFIASAINSSGIDSSVRLLFIMTNREISKINEIPKTSPKIVTISCICKPWMNIFFLLFLISIY